ncbi:hypothetical protein ACFQ1S_09425 [Kibdelosporangium lantanae]|uniref:Gfo/Idh/MocA-like oxidoreductase N-terminal domain-containing protein n=1 Tax=Kibdelosporangium lantanae TaxID=1497396 RepID=A0ABW3M525_9PSEU
MRLVIVGFGHAGRQHAEAVEQIPHITVHSVLDSAETVNVAPFSRAASWSDVLADDWGQHNFAEDDVSWTDQLEDWDSNTTAEARVWLIAELMSS